MVSEASSEGFERQYPLDNEIPMEFEDNFKRLENVKEDFDLMIEQSRTEHKYWLSDFAVKRIQMNQNFILLITGQVGSGKSYGGISFAEDVDPYFDTQRIVFHPEDFLELLDMGLPKGSAIMWEEVGVSLSSRDWYKESNKIISSLFETFRRHNLILIMTVPNVQFIDSRIRAMVHGYGEMIDPTFSGGKFGWMKYFHVIPNLRTGKIIHKYPRIFDDEGRVIILQGNTRDSGNMHFSLPSEDILVPYEEKKLKFVQWQQKSGLEKFKPKEVQPHLEIVDFVQILRENPRKYKLIKKDEKETLTNLIEHNWVLIQIDFPEFKKKKQDMISALRFVMNSLGHKAKAGGKKIQDNEIYTVIRLFDIIGENYSGVANSINTTDKTLKKKVQEWKTNGSWEKAIREMRGEDEDDEQDDKETD